MSKPSEILEATFQQIAVNLQQPVIANVQIRQKCEYVAKNLSNRAGVRLLMSCLLAKIHNPAFDVRKPYTQIGGEDSFSGRTYDEQYITSFINKYNLPCNNTTAFLTPALRNRNETLVKGLNLVGRPPELYVNVLDLLDNVYTNQVLAIDLLAEVIRLLIILRDERQQRITQLTRALETTKNAIPLSSENIVKLIEQHLGLKGTSRLPVLIVAAAYNTAQRCLGERVLTLQSHNAADNQTGALGDVEITLVDDNKVITSYEMKDKRVTREDIDRALQKINSSNTPLDNYIFITTEEITTELQDYARSLYVETNGVEFVVLDCVGFIRHYLHLFHRLRSNFLQEYQSLILSEPESSLSQP
ncbi:MAG: restriction endonuclease, SacI family, partial [Pseudanabaena sp.]